MKSLKLENSIAYLRNDFRPFSKANLSIASSPVLYGLSIYTVFPVNWNNAKNQAIVFRLNDHYQRLVESSRVMDFGQIEDDWNYEKFKRTVERLVRLNKIHEDVLVRVSIFVDELAAGTRIHGLKISLSMYIYPVGEILHQSGVNLGVSSWVRASDNSLPPRAKINGSYVNASLMKNEAILNGYDDAIALDASGHVSESTVANIFLVKNGRLITPSNFSDNLEGITKNTLWHLAADMGIEIHERIIDRSELYTCDEAFLCGSSAGVVPILSIDRRLIANAQAGPLTSRLAKKYKEVIHGNDPMRNNWYDSIGD